MIKDSAQDYYFFALLYGGMFCRNVGKGMSAKHLLVSKQDQRMCR